MKRENKKFLSLFLLGILMISFLGGFVLVGAQDDIEPVEDDVGPTVEDAEPAQDGITINVNIEGALAEPIDSTTWYGSIMNFFGFGETWAQALVSIFIVLIIIAAIFEILKLTAFESPWVRVLIGIGIAGIVSVTGALRAISGAMFLVAGGISVLSIGIVIIVGAVSFVLIHFGVSKLAVLLEKSKGEIAAAKSGATAEEGAAVLKGAGKGIKK